MPRRDAFDALLTLAGWLLLGALLVAGIAKVHTTETVGGPMTVFGPLRVRGNLYVGGPVTVHGPVRARRVTVGGPFTPKLPLGEKPGSAPQTFETSLAIGGPLNVYGPLVVKGRLGVGGSLISEPAQ